MFYEIEEDSKLLLNSIVEDFRSQKNKIKICEMGVGSGFVVLEISKFLKKNNFQLEAFGFDINRCAILNTRKIFKQNKIEGNFILSNLFEKSNQKYDLIFFNTPYLPCENNEKYEDIKIIDKAIYGGRKGYEITIKFLESLDKNLDKYGVCYFLISTLTKPDVVERKLKSLNYKFKIINSKKEFFEELLVYKITK